MKPSLYGGLYSQELELQKVSQCTTYVGALAFTSILTPTSELYLMRTLITSATLTDTFCSIRRSARYLLSLVQIPSLW